MVQDAHEFLNYLLNECSELLEKEAKATRERENSSGQAQSSSAPAVAVTATAQQQSEDRKTAEAQPLIGQPQSQAAPATWVHELFQVCFVICSTLQHSQELCSFVILDWHFCAIAKVPHGFCRARC